ncbi:hypothetical protein EYF80_053579 [Liparis tanakae]|uniref:Uncharacterized protein n=1 Tax=Liparis tanakae TaxID=230148 RepID=A0A4Z2F7F2_9TELE|nr:hypothetical protein EYF80_053579 [Liparis tanakae]
MAARSKANGKRAPVTARAPVRRDGNTVEGDGSTGNVSSCLNGRQNTLSGQAGFPPRTTEEHRGAQRS